MTTASPPVKLKLNATIATSFLRALGYDFGAEEPGLEVRCLGSSAPRIFWPGKGRRAWGDIVKANRDGLNVYYGICQRNDRRGNKEHILSAPALWADIDAKIFKPNDEAAGKAAALEALKKRLQRGRQRLLECLRRKLALVGVMS